MFAVDGIFVPFGPRPSEIEGACRRDFAIRVHFATTFPDEYLRFGPRFAELSHLRITGRKETDVGGGRRAGAGTTAMIPIGSGVRVWIATGHTDMRRGMNTLALMVQQTLHRDPHGGDLYVFRGKSGKLIKVLWHDGIGMSLYLKRLERGRFVWPSTSDGAVVITSAQLGYLLEGIDWRNPVHSWRPSAAG